MESRYICAWSDTIGGLEKHLIIQLWPGESTSNFDIYVEFIRYLPDALTTVGVITRPVLSLETRCSSNYSEARGKRKSSLKEREANARACGKSLRFSYLQVLEAMRTA